MIGGWPQLVAAVLAHGPESVLDAAHQAAATGDPRARRWPRYKAHDDKALAVVDFTTPSGTPS
ncbi:hypothetical protein [Nonomuraea sp. NPDC049400]|uniref:hypothetical protein n=1 Tax=Nonomuraea sp. NPDC049400 TaxID=3364352 RepID=UPI0037B12D4E